MDAERSCVQRAVFRESFEKCPQTWIEERDIEQVSFEKATWIPLVAEKVALLHGRHGTLGRRKAYLALTQLSCRLTCRPSSGMWIGNLFLVAGPILFGQMTNASGLQVVTAKIRGISIP